MSCGDSPSAGRFSFLLSSYILLASSRTHRPSNVSKRTTCTSFISSKPLQLLKPLRLFEPFPMPKRLYDVVTIGSATQDVFLVSDEIELVKSKRFRTGVAECVSLGSKIEVDKLFISSGGGATNAAATFASLGFRTACLAKVGEDL